VVVEERTGGGRLSRFLIGTKYRSSTGVA
jgi:hypothetical protein